ncbi:MAG TPA: nucleotidyltransferase family protein [Bacteroidales bacterium]|nr:nucleotidyltransferase family protein [Bacteroidales bacterium]
MITNSQPSPEELLLIALCRLDFSAEQSEAAKALSAKVTDWEYFVKLANEHGISSLVHHNLEKLGLTGPMPEKELAFLKNANMLSMARNAAMMGMLSKAVSDTKLKTVLLKGAALELIVYGNNGLRQMSDIDLLLTKEDCMKAYRLLQEKGFKPLEIKSVFHRSIISYIGKHLPSLIRGGMSVELHHRLFDEEDENLTSLLYESSKPFDLSGVTVYLPDLAVFFLYLVKHLDSHELTNESQLRLHADLVVLLERFYDMIISEDLLKYTAGAGLDKALASKLQLLAEFWEFGFPAFMQEFISINYDESRRGKFIYFLRRPKNNPRVEKSSLYRKNLGKIPGLHRKFLYVAGDLFPTLTFMKERYRCSSALKAALYYPHRWGKIMWLLTWRF